TGCRSMRIDHRLLTIAYRLTVVFLSVSAPAFAQAPIRYRLSFPEPEHHWMHVDVRFADVPAGALQIHMSRSSPGHYALYEWAKGFEARPARVTIDLPAQSNWKVATQLHPTADPHTFTAPNLEYLIDSPIEVSNFALRTFQLDQRAGSGARETFRIALHHGGS